MGDPNPLADMDRGGPDPLADLDRGGPNPRGVQIRCDTGAEVKDHLEEMRVASANIDGLPDERQNS